MEKRSAPRIYQTLPAMVVGVDANGETFNTDSELDNFSSGGLYLWLGRHVEQGAKLFITFWPPVNRTDDYPAMEVEVHGIVLRTEPQHDGVYGVAVAIEHERALSNVSH